MSDSKPHEIDGCELNALEIIALAAANRASDLLKSGFYSELDISIKSHIHDLVTQYDVQAEELIISTIQDKFPNHAFIGEEGGVQGDIENEITWILDPIDGTWNFAKQIPSFAISIAATYKGVVYLGVCLDPISNELFIAQRGGGATMNGKKIHVTDVSCLKEAGLSLGTIIGSAELQRISQIRRSGSSVLDLCYVARGALEGFVEPRLSVWDYAAACLIVEEAGGKCTTMDSSPLSYSSLETTTVLASNKKIHEELIKWISMENL